MVDEGMRRAIEAAGSEAELARRIGVSRQAIPQFKRCPPKRVAQISEATGVPKHVLRPDLYDAPQEAPPSGKDAA